MFEYPLLKKATSKLIGDVGDLYRRGLTLLGIEQLKS
jgi:hypothetical protein